MLEEPVKLPGVVRDEVDRSRALCQQTHQLVESNSRLLARLTREHAELRRALTEKLREVVSSYRKTAPDPVPLPAELQQILDAKPLRSL